MLGQHCGFRDLDATDKFYELCAATKNQKPTFMNAVIACGGTGGHLFPGIAVAEVLRDRGHEVMLLISEKDIDALALSGRTNFQVEKLPSIGLPSAFSPAFFGFIRRFYESLSLCRSLYGKFKPQVVLGMGGFTSTAPVVNAVMLGFKECAPFFPKTHTEVTGTPVRTELVRLDRKVARQKLGLQEDLPTLLVMGGSQGASGINQALIKSLPLLQGVPLQVIHLSGARDERLVTDNYRRENVPAYIGAFHHKMEEVYSAADLVVARAGAASLAEFAGFSLPGILIPFPYAADDHQTRNAEIYARADAAILLKQSDLSGELLARNIRELMENPQRLQQMAANCARLAPNDAAGHVANTMKKYTTHEADV